jgi:chloramphenicol O-acetyltransferase type A
VLVLSQLVGKVIKANMAYFLDIDSWDRKTHFEFYSTFDDPFYNMCVELDVTAVLAYSQQHSLSFFHICLYLCITAANQTKEFRYRLRGEKVLVHDIIHPSCTLLNDNNTFSFCDFATVDKFVEFDRLAIQAKQHSSLPCTKANLGDVRDDLIYFSVIPWVSFKTFTHPKKGGAMNAIPNIGIGKYFAQGDAFKLPLSVEVNHMCVDGYHLGQFFQALQSLFDTPELSLG